MCFPSDPFNACTATVSGHRNHDDRGLLPSPRLSVRLCEQQRPVEERGGSRRRRVPGALRHPGHGHRWTAALVCAQTDRHTKVRLFTGGILEKKQQLLLSIQACPVSHDPETEAATCLFCLSDGPICRICHEGGNSEGLLSPCNCTGTLGTVHKSCLEKWLSSSNTSYCELCHTEFSIERRPRPLTEVTKVNALCLVCINLSSRLLFCYPVWFVAFFTSHLSACWLACSLVMIVCLFCSRLTKDVSSFLFFCLPQWLRDPGPRNEKRTLFCDMVCFLFITPLAAISGWLCLRGAQDHLQLGSWLQAVGLIALTIALFTIYVLWTLVKDELTYRLD